jgi:predicted SAM-dependent methyltransferase
MNKWNLGAGDKPIDGYENMDIKNGQPAYPLYCEDEELDEIRAVHLLEHFSHLDTLEIMKHWVSKLKAGGTLKIAVPDLDVCIDMYQNKTDPKAMLYLFGDQRNEYFYHKASFNEESLTKLMQEAGLENIERWESEIQDDATLPVSLNLKGTRKTEMNVQRRIAAVMSVPRLGFTDNNKCIVQGLPPGISVKQGQGVFWDQVLTRMITDAVDEGNDYIITIDYDTWFSQEHVFGLLRLMEYHPEYDAIFPIQLKRDSDQIMVGRENGAFTDEELKLDVLPALTGHFGLTVFRASAFKDLKHPWFLGQPNEDGMWGKNRLDPDIYFWHNFAKCGKKVGMARNVAIGHIQLMCTFPAKKGEKGVYNMHMSDVNENGCPDWCKP